MKKETLVTSEKINLSKLNKIIKEVAIEAKEKSLVTAKLLHDEIEKRIIEIKHNIKND